MVNQEQTRITIKDIPKGVYGDPANLAQLSDRGIRRYHPFSFDFDSTPTHFEEPAENWDEETKRAYFENQERLRTDLMDRYGARRHDVVVQNIRRLGARSMSVVSYHNHFHRQAREAFVIGAYYPALVAACALGERILNHLIIDLRDSFRSSPHYKKIHRKDSFDDWVFAMRVLSDWEVLVDGVSDRVTELSKLRHRSIHFNPETYTDLEQDALSALSMLNEIVEKQFGYFGRQPWFIENTPGAQFIKRGYEDNPFVRSYLLPVCGFVGPLYGMEIGPNGHWQHLDYYDYGDVVLDDKQYAKAFRERDPSRVVTRELIERGAPQKK